MTESERRLAAIMFTDIVGYTAMTQADESRTLGILKKHRALIRQTIATHRGREVKTMGDGFLVEFPSALAAVDCAVDMAKANDRFNRKGDELRIRVGIHVGDVVHEGGDVFGDAVNIASRITTVAESGGVCLSRQAYDQVRNKVPYQFSSLGARQLKNISTPTEVYRLELRERRKAAPAVDPRRRLAVLPFTNMSPDRRDEYFADGLTEEVISTLAQLPEIEVISRTSVMQYKKKPKPIREVFRDLNTGTILEGSVRRSGGIARVTVQMVEAPSDRHLWAQSYDRDLKDVFVIQSEIAGLVADALKFNILNSVKKKMARGPTASPRAHTLYLKGRYHWNLRGAENVMKAKGFFEEAIREDPAFALGYVGLGDCHQVLATGSRKDVEENWKRARVAVDRALELDPGLAEAHASRGVALFGAFQLQKAEEEFRLATELKPSYATAHQWYAQLLIAGQRWDEAIGHIEKAADLDPFSQIISIIHIFLYDARRDYVSALGLAERAVELNPKSGGLRWELSWLCGKLKMFDEMEREADAGLELVRESAPFAEMGKDATLAVLRDDRDGVRRALPELKAHLGETFTGVKFIAELHFYLGEVDEGFEWLEKSFEMKEFDLCYIKSNEFLDGVRTDRRYHSLLRRLGLA